MVPPQQRVRSGPTPGFSQFSAECPLDDVVRRLAMAGLAQPATVQQPADFLSMVGLPQIMNRSVAASSGPGLHLPATCRCVLQVRQATVVTKRPAGLHGRVINQLVPRIAARVLVGGQVFGNQSR